MQTILSQDQRARGRSETHSPVNSAILLSKSCSVRKVFWDALFRFPTARSSADAGREMQLPEGKGPDLRGVTVAVVKAKARAVGTTEDIGGLEDGEQWLHIRSQ